MRILLNVIYYILFIVSFIYGTYFSVSGIIGIIIKSKAKYPKTNSLARFAILIPARNEEKVIEHLITSLKEQDYAKDFYDIYVIPNNCTDNTREVASMAGAKILECDVPTKTKGDVLNFAFSKLKDNNEIDAYVIFDADNVVHPEFLEKMNECYQAGYRVAEGYRDAKNPNDNWISGSYAIFYLMQNLYFNRAHLALGGSASVNGTGFMIKKEVIDTYGFETYTLTEDVEFSGICALRGEKIAFVEDAITYDEYPTKFVPSWKQRRRWTSGNLECVRRYIVKLFKNFSKTKNIANIDMAGMYCGALFQTVTLELIIIGILKGTPTSMFDFPFQSFKVFFSTSILSYIFGVLFEVFTVVVKGKDPLTLWKGILLFPVFLITWIFINLVCFVKKQTKWDEIKHDRVVKIDEIVKR